MSTMKNYCHIKGGLIWWFFSMPSISKERVPNHAPDHYPCIKFTHSEKATKIWNNLSLDLTFFSTRQIMWEIVSNFVAFLENPNFNWPLIFQIKSDSNNFMLGIHSNWTKTHKELTLWSVVNYRLTFYWKVDSVAISFSLRIAGFTLIMTTFSFGDSLEH